MKLQHHLTEFLVKEWLLIISAIGLLAASMYLRRIPVYSVHELQVLYFLWLLFVTVKGLEHSGLLRRISQHVEQNRLIPTKLVLLTFFLSMLVTNDVALMVIVPLTLMLNVRRLDLLVILEALAANAGSALTPFGNPQNLFMYWFYQLAPLQLAGVILPLSLVSLVLLLLVSLTIKGKSVGEHRAGQIVVTGRAYHYLALLLVVILSILHILPWWSGMLVACYVAIFDRRSFRVDYGLLLSFVLLFGLADDLDTIVRTNLGSPDSVFLYSALLSQLISNVPVTLLLARVTDQWQALLWGVSVGGFGNLIGSLANIIAYRLYLRHISARQVAGFTVKFHVSGYLAFLLGMGLYYLWRYMV